MSIAILVCALLAPSAVKFSHIFEDHKHEVCKTPQSSHYHELDLDCEFYKFKLSTQLSFSTTSIEFTQPKIFALKIESQYHFISEFQQLQTSLRGPPSLV